MSVQMIVLRDKINRDLLKPLKIIVEENIDFNAYEITILTETFIFKYDYTKTIENNYDILKEKIIKILFGGLNE